MTDYDLDEIEAELRRMLAVLDQELEEKQAARDRLQAALTALTGDTPPVTEPKAAEKKKAAATGGSFGCDQCDRSFATKHGRSVHITRAHAARPDESEADAPPDPPAPAPRPPEMTYGCDFDDCTMSFFDPHAKRRHMRIVHKVHLL